MKRTPKIEQYQATKILPIIQITAHLVQSDPSIADDKDRLWATLCANIPELRDKSKCTGCGRSMKASIYEADLLDALLILAMAREVKKNLKQGMVFTEANKVHIPTLKATQGILKRNTKCDYLGLIKQSPNWSGTGYWLLTRWAWQALRGDSIHKAAKYWEGNLLGRSIAMTTLQEMFDNHRNLVQLAIAKRKAVKADYRTNFEDYDRSEWVDFANASDQSALFNTK